MNAKHTRRAGYVWRVPAPLRITDLASPQMPADFKAAAAAAVALAAELPWHLEGVLARAREETGLHNFGEDIFSEPWSLWLEGTARDPDLTPLGRLGAFNQLVTLAKNRLLLENLIARHPQILRQQISRPIIICGLPRSGTTHLHNLLSSDPALRALPWWEAIEPIPPREEQGRNFAEGQDPRIKRAAALLETQERWMPEFKRMHDMWPEHAHEEIDLLAVAGSTMYFEVRGGISTEWRDWYRRTDQRPYYMYMRRMLQALQFLRGGKRWVLKSPQHLEQFTVLRRVFPDAYFVLPHRDPVSIVASLATMNSYAARISRAPVNPQRIGAYWAARIRQKLQACVQGRALLPAAQSMDLHFDEFMRDDLAAVQRIYQFAGQPYDAPAAAAMRAFMAAHPRGKHGRVIYDLADFNLKREQLRRNFNFYTARFGVALEGEGRT